MVFAESGSTDPAWNLALEQYLFETVPRGTTVFYLWQNDNTIVIGRNQNAEREIDSDYVRAHGIRVVRRLSGGGAVYHDLGNLNFSFITDAPEDGRIDMRAFCEPVAAALRELGANVEISGRNDMTVEGKKFSGNAQFLRGGRVLHHGTILYDSDLSVLGKALKADPEKIASKGVASVRSRVTNLKPYLNGANLEELKAALKRKIPALSGRAPGAPAEAGEAPEELAMPGKTPEIPAEAGEAPEGSGISGGMPETLILSEEQREAVERIRRSRYASWEWTYGSAPPYEASLSRRIEGCGKVEARMNVRGGTITELEFSGDFFGNRDVRELAQKLVGCRRENAALRERLAEIGVEEYIHGMDAETLAELISG